MDETGTGQQNAGATSAGLLEQVELGVGDGLGHVLLADGASGDGLKGLDGLLSSLANRGGGTRQLDGQKTSVRVGLVGGDNGETRSSGSGLGQEAEARGPLDGGLTTEKGSQNLDLGLGASGVGSGEGNHNGVARGVASSLLTTKVLGGLSLEGLSAAGGSRNALEELVNPLGQGLRASTVGDNGNVGLGVDDIGEAGNVLLVDVLLEGSSGGGVQGGTETRVEGHGVSVVQSEAGNVGVDGGLLVGQDSFNLLVELVGYMKDKFFSLRREESAFSRFCDPAISYWCTWSGTQPRPGARRSRADHRAGSWPR